jgi:alpha-1,6-mannosyltransferase
VSWLLVVRAMKAKVVREAVCNTYKDRASSRWPVSPSQLAIPATLAVIGLASVWLYRWGGDLHRFTQWIAAYIGLFIAHFSLYLLACYAVLKSPNRPCAATMISAIVVVIFAATFRAELVSKRPFLSTDAYRYIWDGRVQAAGISPYRYVPNAQELAFLRDNDIYPKVNRKDYALTPYPPTAEALYFLIYLIHPLSLTAFKAAMSLFDLIAIIAIMLVLARARLDPARAIILAWHPLLIFESAHSGHIESAFIALLVLALLAWSYQKHALAGTSLALAATIKVYPAMLLPAFICSKWEQGLSILPSKAWLAQVRSAILSKPNLRFLAAFFICVFIVYLPYLSAGAGVFGSLGGEVKEEGFVENGSRYFLLAAVRKLAPFPTTAFIVLAALSLGWLGFNLLIKAKRNAVDVARYSVAIIGLFLILTTPRYPWYYAWILPFLCLVPRTGWLYLTGASVLLYLLWYTPFVYPALPLWLGAALYLPAVGLLAWERLVRRPPGEVEVSAA